MIKYKTPIIISTKSSLILRDIELINELSKITYVNIACTIITVDDDLRKIIEPGSSPIIERFKVIDQIKRKLKLMLVFTLCQLSLISLINPEI